MNLIGDWITIYILQDTCVGFLLGGIGELNKNRQPNFLVVDKGMYDFLIYPIAHSKRKTNF